ncbi:ATP-binding cassette domain-containing protein [Micromonospora sp. NPDC023956]|uniref:ABC transporter ATP-binding protein n=1 Tax=Micromonospora sp. NPDC023956 TaxID=3155722 RepID=UPI0033D854B5
MITLERLTKRFGGTTAVDGLDLTIGSGRVTGFLGPNGAGKSTTMRMILGLDRPSSGRALVAGKPYASLRRPLREVGALLDAKAVHPGRTGRHHLLAMARSNAIARRRVDEVLAAVGLTEVAGRRAGTYSLGMGQRLGIAGALLGDPGILIFDEPVNGLDPDGVRWIRGLMRDLAAEGRTVFVSSHLMSEMQLTADHLVVIGRGRLVADASLHEVIARGAPRDTTGRVTVRCPDPAQLAALRHRLAGRSVTVLDAGADRLTLAGVDPADVGDLAFAMGIRLHELSVGTVSLEDAYHRLTTDSTEFTAAPAAREGR